MSKRKWTNVEDLDSFPGELWDAKVARCRKLNKGLICPRGSSFRVRRSFDNTYRTDLSRFPNDPEAHVSGPGSLAKLIDKRKRAGWIVGKPGSLADVECDTLKEGRSAKDLFAESLREAKEICGET